MVIVSAIGRNTHTVCIAQKNEKREACYNVKTYGAR
jgi:hypothetical protein